MSQNPLRTKLQSGDTTLGLWATMECATITEIAVALNIDWVVVDMEHGHLDYKDAMDHIRVVRETGTSIIIRVTDIREDCVKKALDMGAHGVILPLPRSVEDVERGFQYGRYAPRGIRGIGGERAVKWGLGFQEYLQAANEETMIIPMIPAFTISIRSECSRFSSASTISTGSLPCSSNRWFNRCTLSK